MSQSSTKQQRATAAAAQSEWRAITVRLPDSLYRRFRIHCLMDRLSVQNSFIEMVEKFLADKSRAA